MEKENKVKLVMSVAPSIKQYLETQSEDLVCQHLPI